MTADSRKTRAAAISIASNTVLIALKVMAGIVTGSVAILTEAAHSSIDLLASFIAFFSLRKASEPADATHPYGHAKLENLAAAIEGMLILVGARRAPPIRRRSPGTPRTCGRMHGHRSACSWG